MILKIKVNGSGVINLTDRNFLAVGGEGKIYVNGGKAYKIYHDPKRTLSVQKIKELSVINSPSVITPQDIIYDASTGVVLGYTTDFIKDVDPLLTLFTKTYKQNNNITQLMIVELIKKMQVITTSIHSANTLVVDYNELNILVKKTAFLIPYYIDTDSYQTPSFKSSAVMNSIMDRRCATMVNGHLVYNPDVMSDWFSWGILAFYLYTNCHPFRARHPNYKPNQMVKQMDDGISVFHQGSKMPPCTNDLSQIPPRHLAWFIDTFKNGHRSIPPMPDGVIPVAVPPAIITIKGNKTVDVTQISNYGENIIDMIQSMGMNYVITTKKVYVEQKELKLDCNKFNKTLLCTSEDATMIVASLSKSKVKFIELLRQRDVGTIDSFDMFARNSCIYTTCGEKLIENSFRILGDKTIHLPNELENISINSTKMFDGCLIQNLLGKHFLTIPYEKGSCFSKYIPQLDGYRLIDCRSEKNLTIVIAEKKGKYDKFIILFKKDYSDFDIRIISDVTINPINFTVMENGLCLLLNEDGDLELFINNQKIEILKDIPFDYSMKLCSNPDGIFFINGNTINNLRKK